MPSTYDFILDFPWDCYSTTAPAVGKTLSTIISYTIQLLGLWLTRTMFSILVPGVVIITLRLMTRDFDSTSDSIPYSRDGKKRGCDDYESIIGIRAKARL